MTLRFLCHFVLAVALATSMIPFFGALAFAEGTGALQGQTVPTKPQAAAPVDTARGRKILDSFIEEAHQYQRQCEESAQYNLYYNCECLAERYLKIRLSMPDKKQTEIVYEVNNLGNECIDASGIAGLQYEQCTKSGPLLPSDMAADKYCQCYGNTYGKLIEQFKGRLSSKSMVELQTEAYVTCRDPELAKRLYSFPE